MPPKRGRDKNLYNIGKLSRPLTRMLICFVPGIFLEPPGTFFFYQQPFLWDINLFFWSFKPNSLKNIYIYFLAKPILSLFFHLQIQLLKAQQLNMVPYRQGREVIISGGKIGLGQGQQSQPWHLGHPGTVLIIHIQLSFR